MTKKKVTKPEKKLVVVLDIKGTYSILDDPKKREKQRARGPRHIGQGKINRHLRLSGISDKEMVKRLDAAVSILEKGIPKPPVGKKAPEKPKASPAPKKPATEPKKPPVKEKSEK